MGSTQATLDRRVEKDRDTVRIVLSVPHRHEQWDPAGSAFVEFSHMFLRAGSLSLTEAGDRAKQIIDSGSPAYVSSPHPDIDTSVYIFDETVADVVREATRIASQDATHLHQLCIPSMTSLGRNLGEIADALEHLAGVGAKLSIAAGAGQIDLQPGSGELRELIRGFRAASKAGVQYQREATKDDIRCWVDADAGKTGGRAGLGFEWKDGELVPGDDYEEVCAALELVRSGEMSKSKAAAHLDTSARTITRCIEERPRRYGL